MIKRFHLRVGDNKDEVYYLGYRLKLTPSEYKLLFTLADRTRLKIEELSDVLGLSPNQKSNVAVHICAINRKAHAVGERKLILCENSEYYLNENM